MKKSIFVLFIALLIISCEKEIGISSEYHIKLPDAINFFSSDFKIASVITFKNDKDESLDMNIDYQELIALSKVGGKDRYHESNTISLYYDEYPNYPIVLKGTGLFEQGTDNVYPFLQISFMYTDEKNALIGSLDINNAFPDVGVESKIVHDEIKLNSKNFNNVYIITNEETDAYSEFYYSRQIGVVAFRDENNELWVYDKILK